VTTPALPTLRFVAAPDTTSKRKLPLPSAILNPGKPGRQQRGGGPLLGNVAVEMSWEIGPRTRGRDARDGSILKPDKRLLALEVRRRPHRLHSRRRPVGSTGSPHRHPPGAAQADGNSLDLTALHPRDARSRGLGEWVWRKLSTLVS
jgi:hypothetical protein